MVVGLNLENEEVKQQAEDLYKKLISSGIEVLYDDREDVTAGQKFADCDLIGIPYRLVISQKTEGKVEIKKRNEGKTKLITEEEIITSLK